MLKFNKLNFRYVPAVRDPNRVPGLVGADTITSSAEGISAFSHAGINSLAVALTDSLGNQIGNWTPYKLISANTTNGTNVKPAPGAIGGWALYNINASPRYVKFYDKASAPSVGSDTPILTVLVPGNSAGAGSNLGIGTSITFGTGISFATTTGMPDSDTGAVGANDIIVNIFYN